MNLDTSRSEALEFPTRFKTRFPVLVNGGAIADRYGVEAIPANFLIDRNGRVARVIDDPNELETAVRTALARK